MKTAEEWQEFEEANPEISPLAIKKQIQLDAMKEGMRRASSIAVETDDAYPSSVRHAILTAAERLTEKDL